jgi:hypothetical protein
VRDVYRRGKFIAVRMFIVVRMFIAVGMFIVEGMFIVIGTFVAVGMLIGDGVVESSDKSQRHSDRISAQAKRISCLKALGHTDSLGKNKRRSRNQFRTLESSRTEFLSTSVWNRAELIDKNCSLVHPEAENAQQRLRSSRRVKKVLSVGIDGRYRMEPKIATCRVK